MNKKLFAMMMVPVVVVMGGTFAFSAWAGGANAFFGQSAATVGYTESLSFEGTNAMMNPISISNGHSSMPVNASTAPYLVSSQSGGASSIVNVYVNATGLVPGDWVQFNVVILNTGTATLNTSQVSFSATTYNGNGQIISGSAQPISVLQPPVSMNYLNTAVNTGYFGSQYFPQLVFLSNATTDSSTPTHIAQNQFVEYTVYAILPLVAPGSTAGSHLHLTISIPLSVNQ